MILDFIHFRDSHECLVRLIWIIIFGDDFNRRTLNVFVEENNEEKIPKGIVTVSHCNIVIEKVVKNCI